jgi:hypothetical protein
MGQLWWCGITALRATGAGAALGRWETIGVLDERGSPRTTGSCLQRRPPLVCACGACCLEQTTKLRFGQRVCCQPIGCNNCQQPGCMIMG